MPQAIKAHISAARRIVRTITLRTIRRVGNAYRSRSDNGTRLLERDDRPGIIGVAVAIIVGSISVFVAVIIGTIAIAVVTRRDSGARGHAYGGSACCVTDPASTAIAE